MMGMQDKLTHLSLRLIKVNSPVKPANDILLLYSYMRLRGLATLMGVTILGITAFQIYWLKQNYDREKKNLSIKTEITFRETVRNLQGLKFKLNKIFPDSSGRGNVRIFVDGRGHGMPKVRRDGKAEIVETINILNEKVKDSLRNNLAFKKGMVVAMDKNTFDFKVDSSDKDGLPGPKKDLIFKMLYGVDSLQDTLKLKEITTAYSTALKKQNAEVPFTI